MSFAKHVRLPASRLSSRNQPACWTCGAKGPRSEEHTSELQSRLHLYSFPTRRSSDLELVEKVSERSIVSFGAVTAQHAREVDGVVDVAVPLSAQDVVRKTRQIAGESIELEEPTCLLDLWSEGAEIGRAHV